MGKLLQLPPNTKTLSEYHQSGIDKLLFLDFDGVLNAFYRSGTFPKEYFDATKRFHTPNPYYDPKLRKRPNYREPKKFEIVYSQELVENLNKLLEKPSLQLIWVSTWNKHIAEPSRRMGITAYNPPVFFQWDEPENTQKQSRKVLVLNQYIGESNSGAREEVRAAYIDDTTLLPNVLKKFSPKPLEELSNSLLIRPDASYGISREQFEELEKFFS